MSSVEKMPVGYPPLSYCTTCGCDFTGDDMFSRHKTGTHEYSMSEGLRMDPPREDGRRCLDRDEMLEKGWLPFADEELAASTRHRKRVGFGVELWHDPAHDARVRRGFSSSAGRGPGAQDATGAAR